jgi:hypothetical protein
MKQNYEFLVNKQSETVRFWQKRGIGENPFFRGIPNLIYNFL